MAVATGLTLPSDGDTSNATNDLVNNFNILKNSVNNIVADQITDGTVTNAEISTAGILASKIKGGATTDASIGDVLENFISGCWLRRNSDTELAVSSGSIMGPNGELRRVTSALTNSPTVNASKWIDVYADFDATASTFALDVVGNLATPGSSSPTATSSRLIGSIFGDSASDLTGVKLVNYRDGEIIIYSYIVGDGTSNIEETITHGKTFDVATAPALTFIGEIGGSALPGEVSDLTTRQQLATISSDDTTTTTFQTNIEGSGALAATVRFAYKAVLHGSYT